MIGGVLWWIFHDSDEKEEALRTKRLVKEAIREMKDE